VEVDRGGRTQADVYNGATFAASDQAGTMTGQAIAVTGAQKMR